MNGRPLKLTEKRAELICEGLAAGKSVDLACHDAGVSRSAFYDWLARGRAEEEGLFRTFLDMVHGAVARSEETLVQALIKASTEEAVERTVVKEIMPDGIEKSRITQRKRPPDWRAASWLLERRFPEIYGRRGDGLGRKALTGDPAPSGPLPEWPGRRLPDPPAPEKPPRKPRKARKPRASEKPRRKPAGKRPRQDSA